MSPPPVVLAIGGSDPSGGAGIQADLKTLHQHGVYGAAAVSLLTVQSTTGVLAVEVVRAETLDAQIAAVLDDLDVRALKTGALGSAANVRAVALRAAKRTLVVDPVLSSTSGAGLLAPDAKDALLHDLVPLATIVTPNAFEASALTGLVVEDVEGARLAAQRLVQLGARAALVKGGHLPGPAVDVLAVGTTIHELELPRLETSAGHGTGCALASAVAARLALGEAILDAVRGAKHWVHVALERAPVIGHGRGPLDLSAPVPPLVGP